MKKLLIALLLAIPCFVMGQTISGTVIDGTTFEPMPYATVYVNGTTRGTVTNADGFFELNGISLPATVVFSFTGYTPKTVDISQGTSDLLIELQTNNELPEIEIEKTSNWLSNLHYFRKMFLGEDKWGQGAVIRNEKVLLFDNYFIHKEDEVDEVFTATASEPIIVDLPLLGYELYVDLVNFYTLSTRNGTLCDVLGYFYYKPYDSISDTKRIVEINRNRRKAYYHSSQHFLRSLYDDKLAENGYVLMQLKESKGALRMLEPFQMDGHASVSDGEMQVSGLKDKSLRILYYCKNDGTPKQLKKGARPLFPMKTSTVSFLDDVCRFNKDGISPDNSIRFDGEMSEKRIGACLPADYVPGDGDMLSPEIAAIAAGSQTSRRDLAMDNTGNAAQDSLYRKLMRYALNIRKFNRDRHQEKVYLQFDNTSYYTGETIWFKAFVMNAADNRRTESKVLYVDLVAPGGEVLKQQKLKIEAGQADGSFSLYDAATAHARQLRGVLPYPSGFYEIRAYTAYMLNFSNDIVFSRVLPVFEKPEKEGNYYGGQPIIRESADKDEYQALSRKMPKPVKGIDVTFYPEGGQLLAGVPNRVAFKVMGSNGLGINVNGMLNDSLPLTCLHDGMGSIEFTPTARRNSAQFTFDGKRYSFSLPDAVHDGYLLKSDAHDGTLTATVLAAGAAPADTLGITLTCRGELMDFKTVSVTSAPATVEFRTEGIPEGVSCLTLFDRNGTVIATRHLYLKGRHASPSVTLTWDKAQYAPYELMTLGLDLKDGAGFPFRDRFCLSVRDGGCPGPAVETDIRSSLLLSSDLRGLVYRPEYYFESDDEQHTAALDLLMLVQGWEKYDWSIRAGTKDFNEVHRLERNLTLNGWVMRHFTDDPVADDSIGMALEPTDERLIQGLQCRTDSNGYFSFDLKDFYNTARLTLVVKPGKRNQLLKTERIVLERSMNPDLRHYTIADIGLKWPGKQAGRTDSIRTIYPNVIREDLGILLPEADILESNPFTDKFTFKAFNVRKDAQAVMDRGEYTTDVMGYLLEKGLYAKLQSALLKENTQISVFWYVHDSQGFLHDKAEPEKPLLADVPQDLTEIISINVFDRPMYMSDILELFPMYRKSLDRRILMPPLEDGKRYYVVDVHVRDSFRQYESREGYDLSRRETTMQGYSQPYEFYSPQYPDGPVTGDIDYRRTLYWNPNVITDEDGHAQVQFYNNSYSESVRATGAGITAGGTPYAF
ncbi:MAG: carboxypeptidase-like regulatory domain-containing protein [Bacteroidaceae bacterium]|nr:carboxypeptidase-like regulatory domain-containing protein [Bacteroidaceae bacterium]